jgi:hypothetical protein
MEDLPSCGIQEWEGKECYWIRQARIGGAKLLNSDPGGVCRHEDGRLNTTGLVKNFIAKRKGKKPFVNDFIGKRIRRLQRFAKIDKRLNDQLRGR